MAYRPKRAGGWARATAATALFAILGGCDESGEFTLFQPTADAAMADTPVGGQSVKLVERDVEAPDVFQVTDQGLWDGRPSLGGVWVAHPGVKEPERVIIRNTKNSKFVIGALFRRERNNPGPVVQVSSDAAAALGMLAGAPATLNVTALRREEVPQNPVPSPAPNPETQDLDAPKDVETTALDPVAGAAAAIAKAESEITPAAKPAATAPTPKPAPRPVSSLEKPFIQIGIFSVEQNANNTATAMRQAGMVPTVKKQTSKGKTFWRVLVGPAASKSERSTLLKKIKDSGFTDAYPVTN